MAIITLNNNSLSSVTALPAGVGGKVLQVVQATSSTTKTTTSTSFVDTNLSGSITPSSTSSKIYVIANQATQSYNSAGSYGTGRWKIVKTIGGTTTDVTIVNSTSNGNIFSFDYGGSGINTIRMDVLTALVSPSTTSAITFKTQIALGTNGGDNVSTNDGVTNGRLIMMEIAG